MRILVAEDDKKVRSHVVGALRAAGHAVDDTGDGEEAQWLLMEHSYDAAVLDIMMPGRDGVRVTRAARAAGRRVVAVGTTVVRALDGMLPDAGRIAEGARADLAVWDIAHPAELSYRIGVNPLYSRIFGN